MTSQPPDRAGGPTLLLVAHGTQDPAGIRVLETLAALVATDVGREVTADLRPSAVELCFLGPGEPSLPAALAAVAGPVVLVPLLLATGFHLRFDIPAAVAARKQTEVTGAIGPDLLTSRAALDRALTKAAEAGLRGTTVRNRPLVVVAAGSTDPAATSDLGVVVAHLECRWSGPVSCVQLTNPSALDPVPEDALLVNYLLAPGHFNSVLRLRAGRRILGDPIGAHPLVSRAVLERYRQAAKSLL